MPFYPREESCKHSDYPSKRSLWSVFGKDLTDFNKLSGLPKSSTACNLFAGVFGVIFILELLQCSGNRSLIGENFLHGCSDGIA